MPKKGKRLNAEQKADRARKRKDRREKIRQRIERREFSLRNVMQGATGDGARALLDKGFKGDVKSGQALRVLIIGDGDFSFSCSLIKSLQSHYRSKAHDGKKKRPKGAAEKKHVLDSADCFEPTVVDVIATSYDSREQVLTKYPTSGLYNLRLLGSDGKSHGAVKRKRRRRKEKQKQKRKKMALSKEKIEQAGNVSTFQDSEEEVNMPAKQGLSNLQVAAERRVRSMCLHEVDATDIVNSLSNQITRCGGSMNFLCTEFDRIIWNFPHTGEQRVHLNRNLIRDFLEKVPDILSESGRVYITLNWKPPYSLWDINSMLPNQLQSRGYLKFSPSIWPGYGHQTTLGGSGGARPVEEGIEGARSYAFSLANGLSGGIALHAVVEAARAAITANSNNSGCQQLKIFDDSDNFSRHGMRSAGEGIDSSNMSGVRDFLSNGSYNPDAGDTDGQNDHVSGQDCEVSCNQSVLKGWESYSDGNKTDPFDVTGGEWS